MPRIELDPASDEAPYEQVRRQIASQVGAGALPAGERLPTVRALAADLGLAVNTVARAYRELEHDGVVQTQGRRGTIVRSEHTDDADARAAAEEYAALARRLGLSLPEALRLVEISWTR